jgi:DNA-binding CsgD family transcriptional regulator
MALQPLELRSAPVPRTRPIPAVLMPLVEAAERGIDLLPTMRSIVESFGFDSFLYGLSTSPRPDKEAQLYVFTTLPLEWLTIYDHKAYVEMDPRIQLVYDNTMPAIWEQRTFRGKSRRIDEFLDDAARFGVCSGVAFTLHLVNHHGIMIAFNSRQPEIDPIRYEMIQRNLGDLLLFGHSFHEMFMRTVVERGLPSRMKGAPLSQRERQVLRLLAAGCTTDYVGNKLGITGRTVQFHLGSIRAKLDAATREEAVALAIKTGVIALNY